MAYTQQTWADNDSSKPLSAARMTHIESGIGTLDTGKVNTTDLTSSPTTVVSNSSPTNSDGLDGDGWLQPATSQLLVYPPKTAGAWPTPYGVPLLAASGDPVDTRILLDVGCVTWPRVSSNGNTVTMPTGTVRIVYFTAPQAFTATTMTVFSGGTAASGTTYAAMALFSIGANGDLTRLGVTTSDTTLLSGVDGTAYQKTLGNSVVLNYGIRYAAGLLMVGSSPNTHGQASSIFDATELPLLGATLAGQTTMPATITATSLTASSSVMYIKIKP